MGIIQKATKQLHQLWVANRLDTAFNLNDSTTIYRDFLLLAFRNLVPQAGQVNNRGVGCQPGAPAREGFCKVVLAFNHTPLDYLTCMRLVILSLDLSTFITPTPQSFTA